METAMGIRNCACSEVSKSSGRSPPMVVSEVSSTARTRCTTASLRAVSMSSPLWRWWR